MTTEPECPYRLDFWKYTDETKQSITCATREDAAWVEIKLGRIRYSGMKLMLPEQAVLLDHVERLVHEAYQFGRQKGKAEVREALGVV